MFHFLTGLFFSKGSSVWASLSAIHYDPKYYPNPREFDPSRFGVCATCFYNPRINFLNLKSIRVILILDCFLIKFTFVEIKSCSNYYR